jgi:beta-N-acetylhexosaminidase
VKSEKVKKKMSVNLRAKPFFLDDAKIKWVEDTLGSMSDEEKIHQLFCLVLYNDDEEYCRYLSEKIRPGAFMNRVMSAEQCVNSVALMQKYSRIPLLVAANLEVGGSGIVKEGTTLARPMQVAATGDTESARRLGEVCGAEGAAVGCNWSFAPLVDIDYNWRNPITNWRTFGSDVETVEKMGVAYVEAIQKHGVAAAIKHFPGDGRDERDQHVSASVNDLSCEDWDNTYGRIYSACIEAGAKTVMVGHIMQPAYTRYFSPETKDCDMIPASVSPELVNGLLRGKLGFNGLIVTDSTAMAGLAAHLPRECMVPRTIAAGCDMFLFTKNLEEDIYFMEKGYRDGVFSQERLDEAVTRILALKASLGLAEKQKNGTLVPDKSALSVIGNPTYKAWSDECADRAITLVKEEKGIFPITPDRFKRVLFYPLDKNGNTAEDGSPNARLCKALKGRGFEITIFKAQNVTEGNMPSVSEMADKYDLIIYSAMIRARYQPVGRIEWSDPQGANIPTLCHTIPTVFISLESPYHLADVPQVRTYINCYSNAQNVIDALMDKLEGKSEFTGVSPVDAFCGKWDARVCFGPECEALKNK